MDIDQLLEHEAEAMLNEERAMKERLGDWRKTKKAAAKTNWLENLSLVAATVEERKFWASTIEKDAMAQKALKRVQLSVNYVQGPKKSPAIALARLIIEAAQTSKVQIPKSVLIDLEKSSLPAKFGAMMDAEDEEA
jgi:hypothetical protein